MTAVLPIVGTQPPPPSRRPPPPPPFRRPPRPPAPTLASDTKTHPDGIVVLYYITSLGFEYPLYEDHCKAYISQETDPPAAHVCHMHPKVVSARTLSLLELADAISRICICIETLRRSLITSQSKSDTTLAQFVIEAIVSDRKLVGNLCRAYHRRALIENKGT